MLDQLRCVRVFTKIDLWSDYHHILVKPKDVQKIAFRSRYRHYEYVVTYGFERGVGSRDVGVGEEERTFVTIFTMP